MLPVMNRRMLPQGAPLAFSTVSEPSGPKRDSSTLSLHRNCHARIGAQNVTASSFRTPFCWLRRLLRDVPKSAPKTWPKGGEKGWFWLAEAGWGEGIRGGVTRNATENWDEGKWWELDGVVVGVGRIGEWEGNAMEEETKLVEGAAECRRREFLAARGLAHEGMRRLGVEDGAVLREGRAPRWPEGVAGALSHASGRGGREGWAAAAVGRREVWKGMGIDLEWVGRVGERLWGKVFNEREREALEGIGDGEWRELAAGIGFSAKEAFFKLFHPLTGRWAEFHDATVVAGRDGRFVLECGVELPGIPGRLEGRWWRVGEGAELVVCWVGVRGWEKGDADGPPALRQKG